MVGENFRCVAGSDGKELTCSVRFPRGLEQKAELGCVRAGRTFLKLEQRLADCLAELNAPRHRKRCEQHVLIENVNEPVPRCDGSVSKLVLIPAIHEGVDALEIDESFLDVRGIESSRSRHDCGIEVVTLYRSCNEQMIVRFAELSDLPLNHAAH